MKKTDEDKIHIFIDSNIYLSFYELENKELEDLKKLFNNNNVKLCIPCLVKDEVWRNRHKKIEKSLDSIESQKKCIKSLPHSHGLDCKELLNAKKSYESQLKKLQKNITKKYLNETLPADKLIKEIFETVEEIVVTDEMITQAQYRIAKGNPPGKKNSYADAINWECLLENVPQNTKLFIITQDDDYRKPKKLHKNQDNPLNSFLMEEWNKEKKAKSEIFRTISEFAKKHPEIVDIKIPSEEKSLRAGLIEKLSRAQNFKVTHFLIEELSKYESYTEEEKELLRKALDNGQVLRIIGDDDVKDFYIQKVGLSKEEIERLEDVCGF